MTEEDIKHLSDRKTVRLLSEAASERGDLVAAIAEEHHIQTCETRILGSIWYRLMDDRRDALSLPNPQTFEWALNPTATDLKWDNIASWLQHGSGIYWVCGKAGSGKSTLMKYISSHPKTKKLLVDWTDYTPLTIASFFFWYLGTEPQRSQEGLSRALLFKILDTDRSLIHITTPSSTELQQAFEKIGQTQILNRKFCLFVDGLDEYSGKPMDGAYFLQNLARNPNIKIIVSSRPMQSCVQAFSRMPKLYLQDLTAGDICTYIQQQVDSHPHMSILRCQNLNQTQDLIDSLIGKAYGVFLWVVLACQSVREGLDNFDHLSDLWQRVDELPPELERLFQHMLSKIERRYQSYAAKVLRICHQNHLELSSSGLFTLGLALADDNDFEAGKLPSAQSLAADEIYLTPRDRQRKNDEKYAKCMVLEGRLRSHCFGLVEIKRAGLRHSRDCFCSNHHGSTNTHHDIIDSTVVFMHRTVFDFLNSGGFVEIEYHMKDREPFDPNSVLSSISLHLVGVTLHNSRFIKHVEGVLVHASNASIGRCSQVELILRRLQELLVRQPISSFDAFDGKLFFDKGDDRAIAGNKASKHHLSIILAIDLGLIRLLQLYESKGQGRLSDIVLRTPFLRRVIDPSMKCITSRSGTADSPRKLIDMVRYLLASGCSPNERFLSSEGIEATPWTWLLQNFDYKMSSAIPRATFLSIIDLFIDGGADLNFGEMFFTQFQASAKANPLADSFTESMQLYDYCLQKVADHKAKSPLSISITLTQDKRALNLGSTNKQQMPPRLRTSRKRARSLSPPNFDRSKLFKLDTEEC
ncbi:hypothetical protein GJ744_004714 [Endocarpon pusillum]|uniref:NACHT domain-containing protein n=1 Tax=Endocarpon pusillum TaxID=364733 RepID=A0A8H7E010_9EURO|nr:hypothetical protein GJ744_004714 [Endocarpon pusillum]